MTLIDFLKFIGEIRNNCGLKCTGPNYYIFIHKGLRRATVNNTGYINMCDVEYIIVVCAHNWENMGYINTSLTQLLMVDKHFNPIDGIQFGNWTFKGLGFTRHSGSYYNAWKPYPNLELTSNPSINNYKPMTLEEIEKFPEWDWKNGDIKDFTATLEEINAFADANKM